MTANEAIRRIREHNEIHSRKERNAMLITEALNMAVEALEKQIPKKALKTLDEYYICPKCKNIQLDTFFIVGSSYCHSCGQKIDWSEEE